MDDCLAYVQAEFDRQFQQLMWEGTLKWLGLPPDFELDPSITLRVNSLTNPPGRNPDDQ